MKRFLISILPFVSLALGCRSLDYPNSSHLTDQTMKSGIRLQIWSQVAGPEEMADAEREVVFNHHLDAALEELGNSDSEYGLVFANAKMQAKLKAISSARPEPKKMVDAPVTNEIEIDLDAHFYPHGSNEKFVTVPVPAGSRRIAKLQQGRRYHVVLTSKGTNQVVDEFSYDQPAYEGIPATVRYQGPRM